MILLSLLYIKGMTPSIYCMSWLLTHGRATLRAGADEAFAIGKLKQGPFDGKPRASWLIFQGFAIDAWVSNSDHSFGLQETRLRTVSSSYQASNIWVDTSSKTPKKLHRKEKHVPPSTR